MNEKQLQVLMSLIGANTPQPKVEKQKPVATCKGCFVGKGKVKIVDGKKVRVPQMIRFK